MLLGRSLHRAENLDVPGTRLNDCERRLLSAWDADRFGRFPLLRSIEIDAPRGRGLRGIRKLRVDFKFPVSFLSGQNGCGKSTLLSLAALAFHGNPGHVPSTARRHAGAGRAKFGYYTFQDFFHAGPGDSPISDVQIAWGFSSGAAVSLSKQTDKWMRYERRPKRPVEFLGLSRSVPAIELPTLRNHFGFAATPAVAPLTDEARRYLERVLGRTYPSAEVLNGKRYAIRRSGREGGYTSFNMGTGEDELIGLLAKLEAVPEGSIVVIEELESGLHPAAQRRVTQSLIEIAWERKLQVIGSTHSHHVLDQLPRQARILLIREGDAHRVVPSPSTQLALSEIAESRESELLILCEDEFACGLVQQMLPSSLRKRVGIRSCGAKNELALQAQSYLRLADRARCLILWDGDVDEDDILRYVSEAKRRFVDPTAERRLSWAKLPGTVCPELWALNVAKTVGLTALEAQFNFLSPEEASAALMRCGLADPHSVVHELATHVQLPENAVAYGLQVCVARAAQEDSELLAATVQNALNGDAVPARAPNSNPIVVPRDVDNLHMTH